MTKSLEEPSPSLFSRYQGALQLVFCASGICFSYWFYGFLQEKILSQSSLGATFILVGQTLSNVIVAWIWAQVEKVGQPAQKSSGEKLNHLLIFSTTSTYVIAMAASNEALQFVSYPTAVLAKSCKMIPTMVMGYLMERRQYKWQQWVAALLISAGIAVFNLTRVTNNSKGSHGDQENGVDGYWKGMALLTLSLGMDGVLGACQGFIKRPDTRGNNERPPTAVETMLYMNLYALLFLVPMAVASGQWAEGIELLATDSYLLKALLVLNAVVAIGQIFIFLTITWYSSLVCTTITTTRKFFTILLSVLHFGHHFSLWQWISVGMVFGGLYLSIVAGKSKGVSPPKDQSHEKKD